MKLLVFEYSSICLNENLLSEGFSMLKSILDDLDNNSFFETYYLINKELDFISYSNLKAIYPEEKLIKWLDNHAEEFDYALFIAPEDNLIQYKITKILEKKNVNIIGSNSNASYICSSKNLTYQKLDDKILKINTIKLNVDEFNYEIICNKIKKNKFIIKPDNKTSSDLVYVIDNKKVCEKVKKIYEDIDTDEILIQEYIEGEPISVSLMCNNTDINFISINSQEIILKNNKIEYKGCITPLNHPYEKKLITLSEKIIKSVPGLRGFVGIDYIIQKEKIYFVEINSRITTPYIVLQKICSQNLTNTLINFVINNKKNKLTFEKLGEFHR